MKKTMLLLLIGILTLSGAAFGQSKKKGVEVLYFKANLACCKARSCSALQSDVEQTLAKHFAKENIEFRVVPLADQANATLVDKYKAKSQTVVVVKKKGKQEEATDISDIVRQYSTTRNKDKFETDLKEKVQAFLR